MVELGVHPAGLAEVTEADSFLYYVMPYVEGESLRDRLDRERQLPVDDAVRIARDDDTPSRLLLVENWFEEVKERVGSGPSGR